MFGWSVETFAGNASMITASCLFVAFNYIGQRFFAFKNKETDTENVEEMVHVMPMTNVLREDERKQPFSRESLLEGAPERSEDSWQVPKVVK